MKKHILNILLCLLLVLSLSAVAAAATLDTTNLTINGNTVVIGEEEDEVLAALHENGRTAKLAIPFAYTAENLYVVKDGAEVVTTTPEWNDSYDMLRFPVTGAGTYEIRTGVPETVLPGRVDLSETELADETTVWVDGVSYPVQEDASGNAYVDLPEAGGNTMVSYGYHEDVSGDIHTRYPVSMKVWALEKQDDGSYTAERVEELDNILQYSGMSIRITGKKGIRMITSIDRSKKNDLVSDDLAGYSLKEYGTVVAWADQVSEEKPLVLGKSYAMSNYAYRKGVADPVYHYTDTLMQYTNVLVNFNNEQCKKELAMRSYMILENEAGEEVILYGGMLYRSIGYIAYQNRKEFDPGTDAYRYIWDIIHYVYGNAYDADYREA